MPTNRATAGRVTTASTMRQTLPSPPQTFPMTAVTANAAS